MKLVLLYLTHIVYCNELRSMDANTTISSDMLFYIPQISFSTKYTLSLLLTSLLLGSGPDQSCLLWFNTTHCAS